KAVDGRPRISIIYKNETRANHRGAPAPARPAADDRRATARLAADAHRAQSRQELRQMRERRGASDVGSHRELSGRANAPVQLAPRTDRRGAPVAGQLSAAQRSHRSDLRAQSRAVASG